MMIIAIILAGGTGTRLGGDIPKQYIEVKGKPIISYCLERFEKHKDIESIIIVATSSWYDFIQEVIVENKITKFSGFAEAGENRQHSILNGMKKAFVNGACNMDSIVIHDAARPNVSDRIITECINNLENADGVMPVVAAKDTYYYSEDGTSISSLINRDKLVAGQAPESFSLGKYYSLHDGLSISDLGNIRGSCEIAYSRGLNIRLIKGDEHNYKITTIEDLEKFRQERERENH